LTGTEVPLSVAVVANWLDQVTVAVVPTGTVEAEALIAAVGSRLLTEESAPHPRTEKMSKKGEKITIGRVL
jgi:hypothetical protein